mgnify:CR=1 FL=1
MGAVNALFGCNSIRLVVLLQITACTEDRAKGARDMATNLSKLVPDYDKIQDALTILINRKVNIPK